MKQQDLGFDAPHLTLYFLFTAAVSSSFRTNFFLRASEINKAESSSRRDVQPRLYLKKKEKHHEEYFTTGK